MDFGRITHVNHNSCRLPMTARHLDSNVQVDIDILDISKAFDEVLQRRLAIKFNYYGIRDKLLSQIVCFLQNRTQLVATEGHCSLLMTISLGVAQGTNLGPTLFLLYIIKDIAKTFKVK